MSELIVNYVVLLLVGVIIPRSPIALLLPSAAKTASCQDFYVYLRREKQGE